MRATKTNFEVVQIHMQITLQLILKILTLTECFLITGPTGSGKTT